MRLLVLSNRYPPYYTGGYEIACQTVTERLRERGCDVKVMTSNYGLEGKTVVQGHIHRVLHRRHDSANLVEIARWEIADNENLKQVLNRWQPDVVYAWCMLQLFASLSLTLRESGIPMVFNIQDSWLPLQIQDGEELRREWLKRGTGTARALVKDAMRAAFKLKNKNWLRPVTVQEIDCNHVIFCSEFRRKQHINLGLPLGDSRVIYNGIDLSLFNGQPKNGANSGLKIIFAGRLVPEKGVHTAIEAIAELNRRGHKAVELTIAGSSYFPFDYADGLKRLVEVNRIENQVNFIGAKPNQELPQLYRQHDVLVFPSIGDEGFPVTILEAMACGLAVVGTPTGGSSEILENEVSGLRFNPDDSKGLADCLERLIDEPLLRKRLAEFGQQVVKEKFRIETIVEETIDYLHKVSAQ